MEKVNPTGMHYCFSNDSKRKYSDDENNFFNNSLIQSGNENDKELESSSLSSLSQVSPFSSPTRVSHNLVDREEEEILSLIQVILFF